MEKEPVKVRNIFEPDITRMIILLHAMPTSLEEQRTDRIHMAFPDPRYVDECDD